MGNIALYVLGIAAVIAGNLLVAWELGRYFTEVRRPIFNFKPFNCRPCFTFWASFIMVCLAFGVVIGTPWWVDILAAALAAFINYKIVTSKFKVYE